MELKFSKQNIYILCLRIYERIEGQFYHGNFVTVGIEIMPLPNVSRRSRSGRTRIVRSIRKFEFISKRDVCSQIEFHVTVRFGTSGLPTTEGETRIRLLISSASIASIRTEHRRQNSMSKTSENGCYFQYIEQLFFFLPLSERIFSKRNGVLSKNIFFIVILCHSRTRTRCFFCFFFFSFSFFFYLFILVYCVGAYFYCFIF